jgi:hypothetical protein
MQPESEPKIRIELFGGPLLRLPDGSTVTFQEKQGALLALLALARGNRLPREAIRESLWPDEDPDRAGANLRQALYSLRRSIPGGGEILPPRSPVVSLNRAAGVGIDSEEFDLLFAQSREAAYADEQIVLLSRLDTLYRGPLAPQVYVDEVVRARDRYETKIEEVRRCLGVLVDERDASEPIGLAASKRMLDAREVGTAGKGRGTEPRPEASRSGHVRSRASRRGMAALALAALALTAYLVFPRRAPSFEERTRVLLSLRHAGSAAESEAELRNRMLQQAELLMPLAEEANKTWNGPDEQAWIAKLMPLDAQIRNTLGWLAEEEPEKALQLTGALSRYWWVREKAGVARGYLQVALKRAPNRETVERARAISLHAMCILQSQDPRTQPARTANRQALSEIGEAYAIYARLGDHRGRAHTLRCTGHVLHALERDVEAARPFEKALELFRTLGDRSGEAYTYWGMSLLFFPGETEYTHHLRSAGYILRSAQLYREVGNDAGVSLAFPHLNALLVDRLLTPKRLKRPEVGILLKQCADEYKTRLERPDVMHNRAEAVVIRKYLARTAIALKDRPTAVEQLGHLISQFGDPQLGRSPRFCDVADAYVRNIHETNNPPLSAFTARQLILLRRRPGTKPKPLTLEAAVAIATR